MLQTTHWWITLTEWVHNVWCQNFKMVTSQQPLSQFTLSCSICLLHFWWFRCYLTDVTPPKSSFTQTTSCNTPLFQILYVLCTTLLSYFSKFSDNLLLPCTVWMYAEQFHAMLCHLNVMLHCLNVFEAISCKAVPFDGMLYNLTKYCAISSKADLFDLTLICFAQLCAISCKMLGYSILACINCHYALPLHVLLSHLTSL